MANYATVKATGETITVYKLHDGTYHDYDNMGVGFRPQSKTGKKIFTPDELVIGKEYHKK